jgi:hypothetical protein
VRAGVAALAATLAMACGGEESPQPTGRSMAQAPAEQKAANEAPVIESLTLDPASPRPGQSIRALVKTRDADGDPVQLSFQWRAEGRLLPDVGDLATVPDAPEGARIEVTVVAMDGRAESAPRTAAGHVGNEPPELVAVVLDPPGEISVGNPVVAIPQAQDPDGDAIEYRYTWRVNGVDSPETSASLQTAELRRGDTVQVRVVAFDGQDESEAIESPPLRVGNALPKITSQPAAFGADGTFAYTPEVTDPDNDRTLRFRLSQSPEGMTIDALSGAVHWKPTASQKGKHPVEIRVDDLQGGSATQRFELSVGVDAAVATTPPPPPIDAETNDDDDARSWSRAPAPTGRTRAPSNARESEGDGEVSGEDDETATAATPTPQRVGRRGRPAPQGTPPAAPGEDEPAE